MSELDQVYVQARTLWEREPETLEREQPLLAKAFAAQGVDQSAQLGVLNRHIEKLEARSKDLERELEDRMAHAGERERRLKEDLRASERGVILLTEELEHTKQALAGRPSEAELLSTLGWSKSAVD